MNKINISELPELLRIEVREALTVYPSVNIYRENGKYEMVLGSILDNRVKASDFKVFQISNSDIYTATEIKANTASLPDFNW